MNCGPLKFKIRNAIIIINPLRAVLLHQIGGAHKKGGY